MRRLVGIDVGAREVRVAHGERTLRAIRLVGVERIPHAGGDGLTRVLAGIAHAHPGATVITALPLSAAAHRILALPFRDARRLSETVPLELLGQLPGDAGDVAVGFETTLAAADGTTVLAAAVRREDVTALRAAFGAAGLVPERVALAPLAVWNLVDAPDAALVVAEDVRSTVSVRRAGRLVGLRALAAAASDVAGLAAEVRWTLSAMGGAPSVIVAGADASPELIARLGAATGLAVQPIDEVASWRDPALAPCALAAGLVAGPSLTLDARADEPATARQRRRLAGLAAVAALLAVVDLGIVRGGLARREAMLAEAVRATAASALPPGTRLVAPRAQLEAAAGGSVAEPARPAAVLALLRELSARVPSGVRLDLDELTLDGEVVRLHGRAEGFESIDLLQRALGAVPGLRDVGAEESRAAVDGRGVEFALRATWRPVAGAPS